MDASLIQWAYFIDGCQSISLMQLRWKVCIACCHFWSWLVFIGFELAICSFVKIASPKPLMSEHSGRERLGYACFLA